MKKLHLILAILVAFMFAFSSGHTRNPPNTDGKLKFGGTKPFSTQLYNTAKKTYSGRSPQPKKHTTVKTLNKKS
jgi:hypothetical protein